jgi:uncharacterized damage-inducible protein DinB
MKTINSVAAPMGRANKPTDASSTCDIARSMLEEFERELGTTRKFLERVPADRLTWRPHEKSMTAGQLALHIAEVPGLVLKMALADEGTPPDIRTRQQAESTREALDLLDSSAAYVRQTLPAIDDSRMCSTFKVVQSGNSGGGRTLMSLPRAEFLRAILLNHWYHHRGQLGVYLRLLGAAVPPSYGPSGDESPFASPA